MLKAMLRNAAAAEHTWHRRGQPQCHPHCRSPLQKVQTIRIRGVSHTEKINLMRRGAPAAPPPWRKSQRHLGNNYCLPNTHHTHRHALPMRNFSGCNAYREVGRATDQRLTQLGHPSRTGPTPPPARPWWISVGGRRQRTGPRAVCWSATARSRLDSIARDCTLLNCDRCPTSRPRRAPNESACRGQHSPH